MTDEEKEVFKIKYRSLSMTLNSKQQRQLGEIENMIQEDAQYQVENLSNCIKQIIHTKRREKLNDD